MLESKKTVSKTGNSTSIVIDSSICKFLGIKPKDVVEQYVNGRKEIVIRKITQEGKND